MVFLPNFCVNLRACLCGVVNYASAQTLDFLDLGQKSSFLDWKHLNVPIVGKDLLRMGTTCSKKNLRIFDIAAKRHKKHKNPISGLVNSMCYNIQKKI
jgi:hypothetical protein